MIEEIKRENFHSLKETTYLTFYGLETIDKEASDLADMLISAIVNRTFVVLQKKNKKNSLLASKQSRKNQTCSLQNCH